MTTSVLWVLLFFFFQAEDGIRDLVRSRGLGDVYKRQVFDSVMRDPAGRLTATSLVRLPTAAVSTSAATLYVCLLYTSDAADERSSVDLGGRRIIKKKNRIELDALKRNKIT
mgnify:CR=1 FL=1